MKILSIAAMFLSLVLVGCGGDDGDSSPQANNPTPNTSPNSAVSLVAKKGHDFSTNYEVSLNVSLPKTDPAFLMVYSEYKKDPTTDAIVPVLSSRMLNVNLDQGKFDTKLQLGKQVRDIVVQVLSTTGDPTDSFTEVVATSPNAVLDVVR